MWASARKSAANGGCARPLMADVRSACLSKREIFARCFFVNLREAVVRYRGRSKWRNDGQKRAFRIGATAQLRKPARNDCAIRTDEKARKPAPRPALRDAVVQTGGVYDGGSLSCAFFESKSVTLKRNFSGKMHIAAERPFPSVFAKKRSGKRRSAGMLYQICISI